MPIDWRSGYYRYHHYFLGAKNIYRKKQVVVYTGLALTLFTISFFALFAIKPTVTTIVGLVKEIQTKKEVDQKLQAKINSLREAQTNYSLVKDRLDLIEQALPQEPDLISLLYQVEILAQKNNTTIGSLSFDSSYLLGEKSAGTKGAQPAATGFSLALGGDFENLNNFLASFESLRRVIGLESFAINALWTKEPELSELNIGLQLKAHYLSQGGKK
jgi:Tfp pilus assembly protein PilO